MKTTLGMAWHVLEELGQLWLVKGLISFLVFALGGDPAAYLAYKAIAVLMVIDLITGIWRASKEGQLSWRVGVSSTGAKLAIYLLFVATARMLDLIVGVALGTQITAIVKTSLVYVAGQEGVSIDGNVRAIYGVGLGSILTVFKRLTSNGGTK